MTFDPDKFLASNTDPDAFDPDAFLSGKKKTKWYEDVGIGLEDLGHSAATAAQLIGGGLANAAGFQEQGDAVFDMMTKRRQEREEYKKGLDQGTSGKIISGLTSVAPMLAAAPLGAAGAFVAGGGMAGMGALENAVTNVDQGASVPQAWTQAVLEGATDTAAFGVPIGRGLKMGAALGAGGNVASQGVKDMFGSINMEGTEAAKNYTFDPEKYLVAGVTGALPGAVFGRINTNGALEAPAQPKEKSPINVPDESTLKQKTVSIIDNEINTSRQAILDINREGNFDADTQLEIQYHQDRLNKLLDRKSEILAGKDATPTAREAIKQNLQKALDDEAKAAFEKAHTEPEPLPKQENIEKTTPIEVALTKIAEAQTEPKETVQSRIDSALEKIESLSEKKSATKEALQQEVAAYEQILAGEKPDTSWFEGKREVAPEPAKEPPVEVDPIQAAIEEKRNLIENSRPNSKFERTFSTVESAIRSYKGEIASLEKSLENINKKLADYEAGLTPAGTVDFAQLYDQRGRLEYVISSLKDKLMAVQEQHQKPFEEAKPIEEVITIPEVVEKHPNLDSILSLYPEDGREQVSLFTDHPEFFNQKEGSSIYFDKAFQDSFYGKTAEKILSHFFKVTGLGSDKIYVVFNDHLPSIGRAEYSGNVGILNINKTRLAKSVEAIGKWPSVSTTGLVGKHLQNALDTFAIVRVGAHEIGHMVLVRHLKSFVTNLDMYNDLLFKFDEFKQNNKLYNVSIFDFRRKDSPAFYREKQKMFHEFFAEEVARTLMYKHTLGAFRSGSKPMKALIDTSINHLENAGMKVDRETFASELFQEILTKNKAEIEATGKTLWEKQDLESNNKLLSGKSKPALFDSMTLEDVKNYSGNNGMLELKDPFIGLDLEDAGTVSTRLAQTLGEGRAFVARKFFGKERLAEFHDKTPEVHSAMWAIRDAEEKAAQIINKLWNGEVDVSDKSGAISIFKLKSNDSPFSVLSNATSKDMKTLFDVFQRGFTEELGYEDNLRKNGQHLSADQQKYYQTLSDLFKKMYEESIEVQKNLGKKNELPFRKGWFPSVRIGRYSVTIGAGDVVAHRQHFKTKLQAEKFRQQILDSDLRGLDVSDVLDGKSTPRDTNAQMAEIIVDVLKRNGYKDVDQHVQRLLDKMNARGGKLGKHHEYRADVGGYKGDEFFKTPDELGASFKEAIEQAVVEKGNQLKSMMIDDALRPVLDNLEYKQQNPNGHAVINQMYESALGRNRDLLGEFGETVDHSFNQLTDKLANILGKEYKTDQSALHSTHETIKTLFYFTKMIPSMSFSIIGQYLNILPGTVSRASYGGHGFQAYKSFAKGMFDFARGEKQLWTAIKEDSQMYNSFTASFIESMDLHKGQNAIINGLKDWVLLQTPARLADSMSRIMSYAVMYTHYRELGFADTAARRSARMETDSIMNLYDKANSAPVFEHLGLVGDFIRPLQGFGQNMLGNLFRSIQYMDVKDWRTFGPFINYTLLTTATSGILSLPFIQEYEMIRKWLKEKFEDVSLPSILDIAGRDESIINRVVPLTKEQRQVLYLGLPAMDMLGVSIDWAKSNRANQTFFTLLAGVAGAENFYKAMPMMDWATNLPSDLYTAGSYLAGGNTTAAEAKKAFENVLPVGAIGYGAKELMGLNTTKIVGGNTDKMMVGKEGQADMSRTKSDLIAGFAGTKSTEQRWKDQITMENQADLKQEQAKKDRAAIKFVETGDPKYMMKMTELGMDEKAINNKIGTEQWNRLVDQDIRQIINKQGNITPGKGAKSAQRIFSFGSNE